MHLSHVLAIVFAFFVCFLTSVYGTKVIEFFLLYDFKEIRHVDIVPCKELGLVVRSASNIELLWFA